MLFPKTSYPLVGGVVNRGFHPSKQVLLLVTIMVLSVWGRSNVVVASMLRNNRGGSSKSSFPLAFLSRPAHGRRTGTLLSPSPLWTPSVTAPSNQVNFFASKSSDQSDTGKKNKKRPSKQKKITKWRINPKIQKEGIQQENVDKLASAFDELAKKEGFDDSMAHFAADSTFEDEFEDGDFLEDDDDDDFLDFGSVADDDDMDARLAAAQRDLDTGRISISDELEEYAREVTSGDLRKLGYKHEENPFGNDETPRKEQFKLITDAMQCPACGVDFQCTNSTRPGYIPPEKHAIQVKLSKIEEMQKLQDKAESTEWSTEDEIEWLIQTSESGPMEGSETPDFDAIKNIDMNEEAEKLGLDLVSLSQKKIICKRCHHLQNFGTVEESLRPGWTEEPLLSQAKFRDLLRPIREKPAVIIAIVDLFDFSGSVLPELDAIAGENPVILAANKADLLPSQMGQQRAENWVRRELEYMGVQSIANIGGAVRLISSKTGFGIDNMMKKARKLADEMDGDIYVVGSANAGKSTLLNYILERETRIMQKNDKSKGRMKRRAGNANAFKSAVTASPLPGTTLKFIKVEIGDGRSLYDTPGLLTEGTLTQLLTPEELKVVVPNKQVEPITFRIASGKCVLVGGLAKIEVCGDSKPFMFTFFVANNIKLHVTDVSKADAYIAKHAGGMLTPPLEPGPERMEQIGEFESHDIDIEGNGWKEAAADITLRGLGWVSVTGPGTANVRVSVPKGIGISVRPPLMPFDVWSVASKYTGGRAIRKGGKTKSGKSRKGVGRK